jgi:hypothetical protein
MLPNLRLKVQRQKHKNRNENTSGALSLSSQFQRLFPHIAKIGLILYLEKRILPSTYGGLSHNGKIS